MLSPQTVRFIIIFLVRQDLMLVFVLVCYFALEPLCLPHFRTSTRPQTNLNSSLLVNQWKILTYEEKHKQATANRFYIYKKINMHKVKHVHFIFMFKFRRIV